MVLYVVKMDKNFIIYVPSTTDVGKKISRAELNKRVDEVRTYVAIMFGGFSSTEVDGGYKASDGDIVEEDIVKVSVGPKTYEKGLKLMRNMITTVRRGMYLKNRNSCKFCPFYKTAHCM